MTYTYDNETKELVLTEQKQTPMKIEFLLKKKIGHEAKIAIEQQALADVVALIAQATNLGYTE